jgi:hypothetical protein
MTRGMETMSTTTIDLDTKRYGRLPAKAVPKGRVLGGHLKTGHMGSPQNRPYELTRNRSCYTLPGTTPASFFLTQRPELAVY